MEVVIVHKHLDEHISVRTSEKEYKAERSMICRRAKKYIAEGESSFVPKGHPGNPYAALHTSKKLSKIERLQLIAVKLEIENDRLKKGYWVEGVGGDREFVTGKEKNLKSLKHPDPDIQ